MHKLNVKMKELPYAVEEAMNRLRVNIKFCGKDTKKILITSSLPGEGKSTTSTYLWKMLAEAGFPTVLVDVDLRKSELRHRLHMRVEGGGEMKGIDHYLSGQAEFEDVLYETNIENAHIVPCVNCLENPSTLLEDSRFREMLDRLAGLYRYVIVDSPPLGSVSDGVLVASLCDGAVLVVYSGETGKSLIRRSLQQIEHANCKLLGVVLNHVDVSGVAYKKYYGHYGGKYYYGDYYAYYKKSDSSTDS